MVRWLKAGSPVLGTLAALLEMVLFFGAITGAFLAAVCWLYFTITSGWDQVSLEGTGYLRLPLLLPVWMQILAGVLYLLLITLYWAPGDEQTNRTELRGFVLFLVVAAIAGAIYVQVQYGLITGLFEALAPGGK